MNTKYFLIICLIIIFSTKTFSQSISSIKPVYIIWNTDIEKVTLKKASNFGIQQPDSLSIEIYFDKETIDTYKTTELKFEFRWYYYLSTKKKLMDSQIVTLDKTKIQEDGSLKLFSKRGNFAKGWWEVQVVSLNDNGFLELGEITQFQMFIK